MQEIEKKKSEVSGEVPIGWEVKKAFEVCGFIVPDRDKPELSDHGIPWITTPDLIGGSDISISKSNLFVSKEYAKKNNLKTVPAKSVIMTCVGDLGIVALTHNEIIINQQLHAFIPSKLIDCYFLLNALKIQRRYFEKVATKTAVPYLNKNNCNSTPILLPPLPEQRAIADCLSTWDGAIRATEQLIRQKELQKKWLMQQLLTGKKRLKGFSGEWEERKLGELCNISKGEQLNKIELTKFGDYPSFSGGVNPSGYTEKWNTYENTIIISEGGNSCGFVNFMRTKFWSGGHCYSLLELKKSISTTFLFQTLKYREPSIMKLRVGSGLPNVQKKDIEAFVLLIPPFEEQQAIASILSESNRELDLLRKRLAKLQEQKKGLMQVLLTGKRRLRIKEL
jgi:type I restriction enzyme S subunit